jgi:divalent metal cation (Fe/Co/Zn/Cd) transporter
VTPDYSVVSLIIIAVAVLVKILLGRYVKKQGEKANAGALIASGSDASCDAILSASVLASALIFKFTGLSLEAYVGVIIAGFIIKAGYEMLAETLDDIIGHREDPELSIKIKRLLAEEPEVRGAYDLILNDYGPSKHLGSVHLELPDTMTVEEVDRLTRRVQARIYLETGVILTGVGVYSYNTSNDEAAVMRNAVLEKVMSHDWALQLHGFHADTEEKELRFDVVMSFDIDPKEGLSQLYGEIQEMYPDYRVIITPDVDVTD